MKVGPLETAAAELRAGRHGSAERKLKKHLKSRPRDPIARHLLGLAHLARGEPGPAVRQFRRTEAVTFNSSVLPLADDEVYAYILFMVFPVYNTIETLDPNQIEAAKDLGASTLRTHLRVVLPHAKPGIAVGSIMTFMLTAGSIAVPGLVGPGLHPPAPGAGRHRAGAGNPRTAHPPGPRRRRRAALPAPDPRTHWCQKWIERIASIYRLNDARLEHYDPGLERQTAAFAQTQGALEAEVERLFANAEQKLAALPAGARETKALRSLLNHREGLSVFVDKPQVPMDNNAAERALRGPVIGRRLSFGSDSETGARFTALLYSVVATLKTNGIDVRRWLEAWLQACAKNGGRPPEDLSEWLPWSMSEERRRALMAPG